MRSALFAFVLLLTGASAAAADDATVTIKNFMFAMDVTVTQGSTVTWKNLDGEPHTVTSADGLFRSPALDQNDSFSFKFDKPGIYKYICSIHPKMRATVTVK
ncbi:MAG TPA: cupredoxin family copper-binding protein [Rhizomicrobium sp.]|jgi:plastocyanin|nr:cupredoxin family copper-binding protein [Rhizomicrobium sp.]